MIGLPVMWSPRDFSYLTHISEYTIYQLSKNSEKYYKTLFVPKKSGTLRTVHQPSRKLKGLQAWILSNILSRLSVSDSCKGFEKGTSTLDNARPHIGANIVVSVDLCDFFPSVPASRVRAIFRTIGYNPLISTILTNLCTHNGGLPQGAPTSPKLANLVLWRLDSRIQGYVGKKEITYTRYADDLTFSGNHPNKVCKIVPTIRKIIADEGFAINESKTRFAGTTRRKKITGLVIGEETLGVGKRSYKIFRAKVHRLATSSLDDNTADQFHHVQGWLAYLKSVDPIRYKRSLGYIRKLLSQNLNPTLKELLPIKFKELKGMVM